MTLCEVTARHGDNVFDRDIDFRGQRMTERITLEEPHRVVFTRIAGPVLGTIANEVEKDGDDIYLRFSFALVVSGVEGGSAAEQEYADGHDRRLPQGGRRDPGRDAEDQGGRRRLVAVRTRASRRRLRALTPAAARSWPGTSAAAECPTGAAVRPSLRRPSSRRSGRCRRTTRSSCPTGQGCSGRSSSRSCGARAPSRSSRPRERILSAPIAMASIDGTSKLAWWKPGWVELMKPKM